MDRYDKAVRVCHGGGDGHSSSIANPHSPGQARFGHTMLSEITNRAKICNLEPSLTTRTHSTFFLAKSVLKKKWGQNGDKFREFQKQRQTRPRYQRHQHRREIGNSHRQQRPASVGLDSHDNYYGVRADGFKFSSEISIGGYTHYLGAILVPNPTAFYLSLYDLPLDCRHI